MFEGGIIKNTMKKINKKKVILFICSFLGFLTLLVLTSKFLGYRNSGPYSWEEIGEYLPFAIFFSLIFAAWMTLEDGDKLVEYFENRKRKKEENREK